MENQPEMIRSEMQRTRTALTEKLEALEQCVLGTVQCTTHAVQETVTAVKDTIEDTMCTVKHSVGDTVETVKQSFDLELQAQRHPWAMVGSAVCAGYLGGLVVHQLAQGHAPVQGPPAQETPNERVTERWSEPAKVAPAAETPPAQSLAPRQNTWAQSLVTNFEPEIDKLKGLAIGALFNVVKGLLHPYVPRNVEPQVVEMVDSVTRKMGGRPLQGSIMEEYQNSFRS